MKILLFEISTSHEECIYSQVKFLTDSGYKVDLLLNASLKSSVHSYKNLCNAIQFIVPVENGIFNKIDQQRRLIKILKNYPIVVFNTASSSKIVRNLTILLSFYKMKCIGILHNGKKLNNSFTQKLISLKIKDYLVLSDYIKTNIDQKKGLKVESFYPCYFPIYKDEIIKPSNEIWISIPGRIDLGRRDFDLLIDCLSSNQIDVNIKFIILGKLNKESREGRAIWQKITSNKLQSSFIIFDEFIPNNVYHNYLMKSDYIMPLLKKSADYLTYKISGSFNLAYAYKKSLLCNSYFNTIPDLKENALFFDDNNLSIVLNKISGNESINTAKYFDDKWLYRNQKEKYIQFISI